MDLVSETALMDKPMLPKLLVLAVLSLAPGCGGDPSSLPQTSPASLAPTPELKAAMEFASAQAFEKSRKTKQALDAYRRIIKEYPDSPQAKIAGDRVKALGGG